jgi:hypothetical protein
MALYASTLNSIHEKAVFRFYCAACCQARARSQCSVNLKACLLMLGVFSFFLFFIYFLRARVPAGGVTAGGGDVGGV